MTKTLSYTYQVVITPFTHQCQWDNMKPWLSKLWQKICQELLNENSLFPIDISTNLFLECIYKHKLLLTGCVIPYTMDLFLTSNIDLNLTKGWRPTHYCIPCRITINSSWKDVKNFFLFYKVNVSQETSEKLQIHLF